MNRIAEVACACVFLWWVAPTFAEEVSAARSISLDEAIARTLATNPELVAAGHAVEVRMGHMEQARLARNPELALNVEDFAGSGDFGGFDSSESTLSLAWFFERGVRDRRVDAAEAGVSLVEMQAELLRANAAAETARRYLDLLEAQSLLNISEKSVQLAGDTVAAVSQRVEAGRAPRADLQRAKAQLALTRLEQRDVEATVSAEQLHLAQQWGDTQADFGRAGADAFALPDLEPYPAVRSRIDRNPDLVRYLTQQRVDEAEVRLAEAQRKQPWVARVGVQRLEATDDHALVASIAIPLGIRNGNQGNIAAARATAEQTRAEFAAARLRAETTLSILYESLERSRSRALELREDIVPILEAALLETRGAYERGFYSFLEWTAVQAELIDARRRLLEASIESQRHVIEIEWLTGMRLSAENQQ